MNRLTDPEAEVLIRGACKLSEEMCSGKLTATTRKLPNDDHRVLPLVRGLDPARRETFRGR